MANGATGFDESILDTIRRIRGVVRVERLVPSDREALRRLSTPTSAENRGVSEALSRGWVLALFKDSSFRPPPEPTLLLVDERGQILGREMVTGESPPSKAERRFAFLGKDFVLFGDVNPKGRLRFSLPPVRFPELEGVSGIDHVVSASPDAPQDDYLRDRFGVPRGKEIASVLIAYDRRNP
ncbi:MAG TPA: hypothetical protein VIB49_07520 [Thermoplasmata archaeon]|jgi:hypothetical protein